MEINERASTSIDGPLSPPPQTSSGSMDDDMRQLAQKSSEKLNAYIQGQVHATIDDYKLLEQMYDVTAQRYRGLGDKLLENDKFANSDMKQVTDTISGRLTQLQKKYEDLRPFLDQINEIG